MSKKKALKFTLEKDKYNKAVEFWFFSYNDELLLTHYHNDKVLKRDRDRYNSIGPSDWDEEYYSISYRRYGIEL